MEALRTPDAASPTFPVPYAPVYVDDPEGYEGLRAAVVDEGSKGATG